MANAGPSPDHEMRRALVVVDLQNGDAHPDSAYVARKRRQHGEAAAEYYLGRLSRVVLPNTQRLVDAFHDEGSTVIFVRIQSLTQDGRDRSPDHRSRGIHFPPGSEESQLLAALAPAPNDIVLSKTSASGFVATGLADLLANLGIRDLLVSGVVTGGCVAATVLDAVRLERFGVAVVEDATATWTPEMQAEGLAQMRAAGAEIVEAASVTQTAPTAPGMSRAVGEPAALSSVE